MSSAVSAQAPLDLIDSDDPPKTGQQADGILTVGMRRL